MELNARHILVTGGAGFIGSHTVAALLSLGARVSVIDNLSTGRRENLSPNVDFYEMNIADPALSGLFQQDPPEIIFHFAFNVLVPRSVIDPLLDLDSIIGSINLLQFAKSNGVRKIIFSSSGFVYGNTEDLPAKETALIDPVTPYVVAKHAVENYLEFYRKTYGLPSVTLRYSAVYGPGQRTGAMADYIRTLRRGDQAEIWGDGSKTRDYVYIDDVVRANLLALNVPDDYSDPVFNIGTGIETSLNDVYQSIARILGREAFPIYHPDRPGEQLRYSLDPGKIRSALGWEPATELSAGLRRTVDAAIHAESGHA
jgi:UDP-glucose 4-epimerase